MIHGKTKKCSVKIYRLPENVEKQLTAIEENNQAAEYFTSINNEYPHLHVGNLPDRVQQSLKNAPCSGHPQLPDCKLYYDLLNRKITSGVDGDLPLAVQKQLGQTSWFGLSPSNRNTHLAFHLEEREANTDT